MPNSVTSGISQRFLQKFTLWQYGEQVVHFLIQSLISQDFHVNNKEMRKLVYWRLGRPVKCIVCCCCTQANHPFLPWVYPYFACNVSFTGVACELPSRYDWLWQLYLKMERGGVNPKTDHSTWLHFGFYVKPWLK